MEDYVKRMVEEHADLEVRINKLRDFIYGNGGLNIHTNIENNKTQDDLFRNMSEYANKCIQLSSMRQYQKALECRLDNEGIHFDGVHYSEQVATLHKINNANDKDNNN